MKKTITAIALAATAATFAAPAAFAMSELDTQLEKSVYNTLQSFGFTDYSEDQIGNLSVNDLVLIDTILADEERNEVDEFSRLAVESRIDFIVTR